MADQSAAMRIRILIRTANALIESKDMKRSYEMAKQAILEMKEDPIFSSPLEVDLLQQGTYKISFHSSFKLLRLSSFVLVHAFLQIFISFFQLF